jgi:tRNA threonylcarbamoyladenosine biosynthesis protein TsaB
MNVLAIDASTDVLAIAAARDDAHASICLRRGLRHCPSLLPLADTLVAQLGLAASDLQLLVCAVGPGSFTGIRIGLATALGISRGTGAPLLGVSTLDAMAGTWQAHQGEVVPVIDARKGRFYAARYRAGERLTDYMDIGPDELAALLAAAAQPLIAGPDAVRIRAMLGPSAAAIPCAELFDPGSLLRIGLERYTREGADPASITPLYLRRSEAEIASGTG